MNNTEGKRRCFRVWADRSYDCPTRSSPSGSKFDHLFTLIHAARLAENSKWSKYGRKDAVELSGLRGWDYVQDTLWRSSPAVPKLFGKTPSAKLSGRLNNNSDLREEPRIIRGVLAEMVWIAVGGPAPKSSQLHEPDPGPTTCNDHSLALVRLLFRALH